MTYKELLEKQEWQHKRLEILKRDKFKCQHCDNLNISNDLNYGIYIPGTTTPSEHLIAIYQITSSLVAEFIKTPYVEPKMYPYLYQPTIVYYGNNSYNNRDKVYGLRRLSDLESKIINENELKLDFSDIIKDLENYFTLYEESKRTISLKLFDNYKNNDIKDFDWLYFSGLHVHHNYYIKTLLPWEYKDDSLVSLCMTCHESLHKNQKVPVYNSEEEFHRIGELTYCSRCHGAGWFPEYLHVQGGICFECLGAKYKELIGTTF